MMFYGSQTSTGPGVVTIVDNKGDKVSYWNGGQSQVVSAIRPNESLYVPQMDLSGGSNTGLSSPDVIASVNLPKQSNVEGYRANIYSNVDGVPTVGNGLEHGEDEEADVVQDAICYMFNNVFGSKYVRYSLKLSEKTMPRMLPQRMMMFGRLQLENTQIN